MPLVNDVHLSRMAWFVGCVCYSGELEFREVKYMDAYRDMIEMCKQLKKKIMILSDINSAMNLRLETLLFNYYLVHFYMYDSPDCDIGVYNEYL